MVLRYCAGGDPLDITDLHGIGEDEVVSGVWGVMDAICFAPELDIPFPEDHVAQTEVAERFKTKSTIGLNFCVVQLMAF